MSIYESILTYIIITFSYLNLIEVKNDLNWPINKDSQRLKKLTLTLERNG